MSANLSSPPSAVSSASASAAIWQTPLPDARDRPALRRALLARRAALAADAGHAARCAALEAALLDLLARRNPVRVALYWPVRGEFDARPAIACWLAGDPARRAALPEVVARDAPMRFLEWAPGDAVLPGAYDIPVPAKRNALTPELILLPCVGFSLEAGAGLFRLGYGGGFYDRTLAALAGPGAPRTCGLAFAALAVPTLAPQAHDVALDDLVTEQGSQTAGRGA